ncbi:hypothetical protein B0H19DRAFT_1109042 [Mycena capillaripes]|nr:hypothetical protein B0H19DRAFT_1109042 [Mycena capillaripes]
MADSEPSITRLPTEILHEICSLTTPVSGRPEELAPDAAWVFSHVCGRWRAAAISHSIMWSGIFIGEKPPPIELLERQLQLSNNLPLTIVFSQTESDRCLRLFEALVACSDRWRRLSLTLLQNGSAFLQALERVRGNVPVLQKIALEGWAITTGNPFAFEVAPALQDVTLRFRPVPIIPWQQLTRLSTTCTLSTLVPILQLAQNLIELTAHIVDFMALPRSNPPQITLPLVSRCLLFHRRIMDVLVLPQLEVFIVEPETASALVSLLLRSSCSLKKLGIYGACSISINDVTSILQTCPALVEMTVIGEGSEPENLDLLIGQLLSRSPSGDSAVVVPQLKHIFLMAEDMDQTRFVDMVESRWRVSNFDHRLEQVTVMLTQRWNDADAQRLKMFRDEGLGLRMSF